MEDNKETLKMINEGNRRFNNKKREENMASVPPQFVDKLNTALDYEDNGYYEKAKDICDEILATEEGSNLEQVKIILARLFPRVLENDIYDTNKRYQQHVDEYYKFLDSITMNDTMQEYIVETLARLCELLENEWYRPLFREFVGTIEKKGYLNNEEYRKTLDSAYASVESTLYFEDSRVGIIMKNVLKSGYDRAYVLETIEEKDKKHKMELDICTNLFYLCRYYEGNEEEIEYIREAYPHSYESIEKDIEEVKSDKDRKTEQIIDRLSQYASDNVDREGLVSAMNRAYEYMINSRPKPTVIHSGKTPYFRADRKIGRNDLCPCGSGRKYKQCCGR